MATAATEITYQRMALLDAETHVLMGRHGGTEHFRKLVFVEDAEESMALEKIKGAVIISASGMCDAGRIKYHLRANLPRPESTILITGFQAAGTLGRRLVDGARRVRIFGEELPVRAVLAIAKCYQSVDDADHCVTEIAFWMLCYKNYIKIKELSITPTLLFPRLGNPHENWLSLLWSSHFTVTFTVIK